MSCEFVHKHQQRQNYYYFIAHTFIAGFGNGKERHLHQNKDIFKI